ncbi:MAG: peroxiredoxin family protein [Dehalococcoidia bacterium]
MANKLIQGDKLPAIRLDLIDGRTLSLPDDIPGRYLALLFYRGTWCPYCKRHLQSYQDHIEELESLGVTVLAASVDPIEPVKEMVEALGLTYPVAYGVTDADVVAFEPWFADDNHGHYIQPMELLVLHGGTLFGTMYGSGPVGRMAVEEVLNSVRSRERRRLEQEAGATTQSSRQ